MDEHQMFRSEKLQNESSPNFSNFRPEFCPEFCFEFSPSFSRSFRASFRAKRRPEKIHQKSPPFFNVKFPGKHEKIIHKMFLGSRHSNFSNSRAPKSQNLTILEDRNLLKLRSLDSSLTLFLSDNRIWGQSTQMLQML